jgi:hypothetical protein
MAKKKARKPPLGSGERFASLTTNLRKQGKSKESAEKIAASIGRAKYGPKKMAKLSAAGRRKGK